MLAAVAAAVISLVALKTWRWRIGTWLWVPYLVPGVVLAIALVYSLNRPAFDWLYRGVGIVVLAWTIRYAAPGWNVIARAMRTKDRDLTDAARLEGASGWQSFRHVCWPQVAPTVLVAGYLTYLLCLWDVETLTIVQPPGAETLASRIFGFLHYGYNAQVNALCLTLLSLALAPLLVVAAGNRTRLALRKIAAGKARLSLHPLALVAIPVGLLMTSCRPASPNEASVDSRLFSRVQIIGTRGGGLGQFNKPRSVAVDAQDNLYVVDMTGRVQKFSPDGVFLSYLADAPDRPRQAQRHVPRRQRQYRCYRTALLTGQPFPPDGTLVAQWGTHGTNAPSLRSRAPWR